MNHLMCVYSPKAFKSYLLPSINNSDYSIVINKEIFCLDSDISIELEVIDNVWRFVPSENYRVEEMSTREDHSSNSIEDGSLFSLVLQNGERISLMYDETDISFSVFDKYSLEGLEYVTIGKDSKNDIQYNNRSLISKEHARLRLQGTQWILEDLSANGVFVNARRVVGNIKLSFGDSISIYGLTIVFLDGVIAINKLAKNLTINKDFVVKETEKFDANAGSEGAGYVKAKSVFHRSPRQIYKIESEPVDIENPPQPKQQSKKPLGMIIGPSMTMALPMLLGCGLAIYSTKISGGNAGAFMYTGLITAVSSALIGTVWALVNLAFEKKRTKEEEAHRFEAYGEYLIRTANSIKDKYERNYAGMNAMYHSAEDCCKEDEKSLTLWNRNCTHSDFLVHRLGIGDMPFQVKIEIPKEKFSMVNDSLAEKPAMIKESYKILHDVPLCVDLSLHRVLGIVSTDRKKEAIDIMHNIVAQIVASNCYTEVKMAFLFDEEEENSKDWEYLKWLPHVWSEDKKTRYFAQNRIQVGDVLYELTKVLRNRSESKSSFSSGSRSRLPLPQYVIFVSNPNMLEGELITKYLYEENNEDITTILLSDGFEYLPNTCNYIIQNDSQFRGMYAIDDGIEERTPINFDSISNNQLEKLSRTLADIEVSELETGGDIPSSLTFFDMYGVQKLSEINVLDKWKKNRTYDSMKALIGQRAGGTPWYLDIHEKYHGPHGLIAGTTGSGKSETLQTYILSLALNYSPDDVGFFIIDYKGGGMANLFNGLPHMIGSISNLSGNQVKRAMVSIKSENKRRQRIFNEHGVNNINLYTRLYKNNEATEPVPHMFIIIDEFAELKREEPDFMRELISVAQVGRSLGVHLILATQKPSGTVDDNIWSNSKFRLCLRVQDRQDSNDMLHRPDAAYITQAGRCYMQVGNDELFELFQSGYSGAVYDEEYGNTKLDIARMLSNTGKAALIGNRLKLKQKEDIKRRWIKSLVETIESCNGLTDERSIFDAFENRGIDYPSSEYNALRVKDLLKAISIVKLQFEDITSDEAVDAIIVYAATAKLKLPEKKERTQLDAVVDYLAELAKENGYVHNLQLWLPVLPERICLSQLQGYAEDDYFDGEKWPESNGEWNIEVPIGMYDDPVNQSQDTYKLNLSVNGHHAIIGTVVSGKSTFIQTLIYALAMKYTADYINIYSLDFSAKMSMAFEKMPQVGGIILENEEDKLAKFFNMIITVLEERKNLFKGGNYSQYVRSNGVKLPAIIICIDNYSSFKNKTNGAYEDIILQLSKDGVSYGIFLVVTAGGFNSMELSTRIGENFRTVVCLELADKFQYGDAMHTMKIETLPEVNIKGRGLARIGEALLEFQTALAVNEGDDFKRMEMIESVAERMHSAWKGKAAKAIPVIPDNPVWSEFEQLDDYKKMLDEGKCIPVGYNAENASVYGIDLRNIYCYLIGGKARTGKTNMIKAILCSLLKRPGQITVIDFNDELRSITQKNDMVVIDDDDKLVNFLLELKPDFVERNKVKKENERSGMSDEEIYADISNKFDGRYIIIANLTDFVVRLNSAETGCKPFVENLLEKGALHNVFWFACYNYDDVGKVGGNQIYELFIRNKLGVHFGGNVASQRIFNFDYILYSEQTKTQKPGIGMLPSSENEKAKKIVIPLVK